MKTSTDYLRSRMYRSRLQEEVYRLYRLKNMPLKDVMAKTGLGKGTVYRYIRNFESENPDLEKQMKKRKDVIPDDYKKLQTEIARLQSELKQEKLRADFYEEMVAFGKEVYGIDLKKAGTK